MPADQPAIVFDRTARRLRRDRAAAGFGAHDFIRRAMIDGIEDRLAAVSRNFVDRLDIGCHAGEIAVSAGSRIARIDAGSAFTRMAREADAAAAVVQGDEDRLPFADASFDLVVSAGVLDSVDDLPGALALARRMLRPDGLFLAAFIGGGSLSTLRDVLRAAEAGRPVARLHPQVDVRAGGDLLMRAGFALPVADVEILTVRYGDLFGLLRDLRGMAATNVMPGRRAIGRETLARAAAAFADRADPDGRTREYFHIIYLTGWAPAPSQPQPARRGSGTASLAAALRPRPQDNA